LIELSLLVLCEAFVSSTTFILLATFLFLSTSFQSKMVRIITVLIGAAALLSQRALAGAYLSPGLAFRQSQGSALTPFSNSARP
jgi:hypothetical protein